MHYFKKETIILVLLAFLSIGKLVDWLMPKEKEIDLETEIKLHDIRKERDEMLHALEIKDTLIKHLQDEFTKIENDPSIDTATVSDMRGFFTEYLDNR